MKVALANYRKAEHMLSGRKANCVDVRAAGIDQTNLTVDVRKVPELVDHFAFQTKPIVVAGKDAVTRAGEEVVVKAS